MIFIDEEFPKAAVEALTKDGAIPLRAMRAINGEGRSLCVLVSSDPTIHGNFETHLSISAAKLGERLEPRPEEIYEAAQCAGLAKPKQWTVINKIAHIYE
jgi:hypothetical protein